MQAASKYIGGIGLVLCLLVVMAKFQGGDLPNPFTPGEQLIDVDGLAVAVVEETSARSRLTPEQLAIFADTTWRNYVKEHGGQLRVLDQHTQFTDPKDPYAAVVDRDRDSLPWLVISTPKGSEEMPLPPNVDEMMKVLKKWAE